MSGIGASLARPDAHGKVTGETRYPADLIGPGMLRLATVFARRAHARITALDTAAALAVPGVVAVLTARDVPHNRYGLIEADQPVLCEDIVRHYGDRVALVVAESDRAARAGAAAVVVIYEDLPAVTDPQAAIEAGAPRVHADRENLMLHQRIRRGNVDAAFATADVIVEGTYTTSWQEHAYLQPEAATAHLDERGRLVVETAGQWLHEDRRQLAEILELDEAQVVVRYAAIGGAFGGREDLSIQALVALATWKLRQPTAIRWTREESIIGHHKRHPFSISAKWGAKRDGTIVAAQQTLVADGGAYASTSVEVLKAALTFAQGPYEIANVATDGYVCYTNNPPSGAFRGFGAPQAHFAAESMVGRVAEALGVDPLVVRRKNLFHEGSIEATGSMLPPGCSAQAVLDRCIAEARARFKPATSAAPGSTRKRGIGIACGMKNVGYSFGFPEQSTATVELTVVDGVRRARVRVGVADVGQGVHLAMRQIAAEALSLPPGAIELITDDSGEAPNGGSASASRLTFMAGRAVKDAAEARAAQPRDRRNRERNRPVPAAVRRPRSTRTVKGPRTTATATSRRPSSSRSTPRPVKCTCSVSSASTTSERRSTASRSRRRSKAALRRRSATRSPKTIASPAAAFRRRTSAPTCCRPHSTSRSRSIRSSWRPPIPTARTARAGCQRCRSYVRRQRGRPPRFDAMPPARGSAICR